MYTLIRDLNEHLLPSANCTRWRAAAFRCSNPYGTRAQSWAVAWGECYAQLSSGILPLEHSENTDEDGVEWFDAEDDALDYLQCIEAAYTPCEEE